MLFTFMPVQLLLCTRVSASKGRCLSIASRSQLLIFSLVNRKRCEDADEAGGKLWGSFSPAEGFMAVCLQTHQGFHCGVIEEEVGDAEKGFLTENSSHGSSSLSL